MSKKQISMLAPGIVDPLKDYLSQFSDWYDEAQKVVVTDSGDLLPFDAKTLATAMASARKHMGLANAMLAQLAKL
jgi:hypothetical protein